MSHDCTMEYPHFSKKKGVSYHFFLLFSLFSIFPRSLLPTWPFRNTLITFYLPFPRHCLQGKFIYVLGAPDGNLTCQEVAWRQQSVYNPQCCYNALSHPESFSYFYNLVLPTKAPVVASSTPRYLRHRSKLGGPPPACFLSCVPFMPSPPF